MLGVVDCFTSARLFLWDSVVLVYRLEFLVIWLANLVHLLLVSFVVFSYVDLEADMEN